MIADLLLAGLIQGLILTMTAYAVMIPFRILNFPDLTTEGSYPLGGALATGCLLLGIPPILSILFSALGAGLMNLLTGLIHIRLRVNTLLAGIILSTMIYSVNLRILSKPNVALLNMATFFNNDSSLSIIIVLILFLLLLIGPFILFLYTDFGLKLRAVGLNASFCQKQGISVTKHILFGLFFAGTLSGVAGGLMVQAQHYMDVGMGVGIVIHALAALMLGEAILGVDTLKKQLLAPLIGALLYQQIQGFVLSLGLSPSDLKFFTGTLVLAVIAFQRKNHHAA